MKNLAPWVRFRTTDGLLGNLAGQTGANTMGRPYLDQGYLAVQIVYSVFKSKAHDNTLEVDLGAPWISLFLLPVWAHLVDLLSPIFNIIFLFNLPF